MDEVRAVMGVRDAFNDDKRISTEEDMGVRTTINDLHLGLMRGGEVEPCSDLARRGRNRSRGGGRHRCVRRRLTCRIPEGGKDIRTTTSAAVEANLIDAEGAT